MAFVQPGDWALRPIKRYAQFSGRAPRAEYWWFYLATWFVSLVLELVERPFNDVGYLSLIFSLATLVPTIAVTVRRFHDIGRSGWWLLILILPFVPLGYFIFMSDFSGTEVDWTKPIFIVPVVAAFAAIATSFIFLVTRGTEGDNLYGPDPYGPDKLEEVFA